MTIPPTEASYILTDGVFVSERSRERFREFEDNYLAVREKEKRVLGIDEVKKLPYPEKGSPDYELWKIRRRNIGRFLEYLDKKGGGLKILDIGCGNGFFTAMMAKSGHQVTGVDVNLHELRQAAEAFPSSSVAWYYADIFNDRIPGGKFDLITFCCSFQYFGQPERLLKLCGELLDKNGEIHIIDSPFYNEDTVEKARSGSAEYYKKAEVEPMTKYYHHNTLKVLEGMKHKMGYMPKRFLNRIFNDSPFPWIIITPGK